VGTVSRGTEDLVVLPSQWVIFVCKPCVHNIYRNLSKVSTSSPSWISPNEIFVEHRFMRITNREHWRMDIKRYCRRWRQWFWWRDSASIATSVSREK
jgi:hypothetical protein